jgi:hypothetical protein
MRFYPAGIFLRRERKLSRSRAALDPLPSSSCDLSRSSSSSSSSFSSSYRHGFTLPFCTVRCATKFILLQRDTVATDRYISYSARVRNPINESRENCNRRCDEINGYRNGYVDSRRKGKKTHLWIAQKCTSVFDARAILAWAPPLSVSMYPILKFLSKK